MRTSTFSAHIYTHVCVCVCVCARAYAHLDTSALTHTQMTGIVKMDVIY